MHLLAIEVWHWRGLEHHALADLSPRLNLVLGPNESGKSRLFEAIRYALFEPSKGAAQNKKDLQGWSATEPPRVRVTFETDAGPYTVTKQFLKSSETLLEGGGETLRQEEAEARLRQLLALPEPAGRSGAGQPESLGSWPLLWLSQGDSREPPQKHLTGAGRGRLQDALALEVGEAATGEEGRRIHARARTEAEKYWTATWKETGELRRAREAAAAADAVLEEARERREALHRTATELAAARERLAGLEPRLERARAELRSAEEKEAAAMEARRQLDLQEARTRAEEQQLRHLREQSGRRSALAEEQERLLARQAETHAGRETLDGRLGQQRAALREADQALKEGEAAERDSETRLRQARLAARRRGLESSRAELAERLARARELQAEVTRLRGLVAAETIDSAALKGINRAEAELQAAHARLLGAAARVEVRALRTFSVDGESLAAGTEQSWTLTEPRVFRLGELAELRVEPGGDSLEALRESRHDAEQALRSLLDRHGAERPEQARIRNEERERNERDAARAFDRLGLAAPDGVEALEESVQAANAELSRMEGLPGDLPGEAEAEQRASAARTALETARARRDAARESYTTARLESETLGERLEGLARESERLARQLGELPGAQALEAALAAAEQAWRESLALRQGYREAWESLGGEQVALELDRARQALQRLEEERTGAAREAERLDAVLRSREGEALHEAVQEAEAEAARAGAELERVERRAQAARLLVEVLEAALQEIQARFTAPVMERIRPYLRRLFPGSELALGEDLALQGLRTGNIAEPFGMLSGGAQEQLAILVRIGLAELLAGDGRLPVILDDALINTDPARLQAMQAVLYQAARGLQVIVFTCQEADFDTLGAERVIRLPPRPRGR